MDPQANREIALPYNAPSLTSPRTPYSLDATTVAFASLTCSLRASDWACGAKEPTLGPRCVWPIVGRRSFFAKSLPAGVEDDHGLRREPRGRLDGIVVDPAGKGILVDHHDSCLSPGRGGSESDPSTATAISRLVIASKAETEGLSGSHGKPVLLLGEGL
jgi:hypothetical protein